MKTVYICACSGLIGLAAGFICGYFYSKKHTETEFKEADLSGTVFINSNLDEADLRRAQYCLDVRYETKFPEGFNPKEHGMIEIDVFDEPVKKSETENSMEE